jgi:hypothetical protein
MTNTRIEPRASSSLASGFAVDFSTT